MDKIGRPSPLILMDELFSLVSVIPESVVMPRLE